MTDLKLKPFNFNLEQGNSPRNWVELIQMHLDTGYLKFRTYPDEIHLTESAYNNLMKELNSIMNYDSKELSTVTVFQGVTIRKRDKEIDKKPSIFFVYKM